MELGELLELVDHGPDTFVGRGPRYAWGGLYGGQILAQGLRAAAHTIDAELEAHSLRAYFIRRGDPGESIRFEVDRLRNGTTFATRRVVARQSNGVILILEASFQRPEPALDVTTATMPAVPLAQDLAQSSWTTAFERAEVPAEELAGPSSAQPGRVVAWLRARGPLGSEQLAHRCALAYLSDDLPTEAVARLHPTQPASGVAFIDHWYSASLDHTIWFHRPVQADQWHLYDVTCHSYSGARGLTIGQVFSASGAHVATVAQEVLVRLRRPGPDA
jgi:acyl-CoA thioesterase-2